MSTLNSTTPSLESLLPKHVPTPEEVRANKKREEAQKVGIGQAFKDVANADWLPGWMFRQLDAGSVGYYDPDFTVTDQRYWPKLTEGLDPAYYEMFGEATNINMAMKIRQQALSIQESNRNIASLGGTGVAVRIVGNVFDPVNILLGMATGGGGFLAKNASRAERFIRGGAFGAAIAAPTEAYRTARDPLQDTDDYMLNMGLAFGLGGIINSIPQAVRAEQAVRAGAATVEETPTSFIIRQKQLTEAPPRTPEPGLVVWQRPMQARDFINRGENPTQWNDVEVPKMKNFDWRPDVADEATRFGQAVPMRSTGTTPTLARRQQLALPEVNGVPDTTQTGQPLAPGSPIGQVGVQAGVRALPAAPKYPSVDEMIAEVDRTGIDPYADVIVDPATGTYEPIPDNVPIDPDTGEPMIDAVLAPENLDEVKFGDAIPADAPKQPWDLTADEQARADKLKERAMRGEADLPEDQAFRDDLQNRLEALVNATPQQAAKMSDKNWQRWRGAKRNGTPDQAMDIAEAALLRGDDIALAAIKNDIADKLIAEPNADATPSEREAFQKKQDDWNATLDAIEEAEKQHKAKRESPAPPAETPVVSQSNPKAEQQPWEMRPSQFRDWSYTQDFKAKRSAAESAEKLASDAVIKLEQEIGASSKGVSSVVTSLDGVSVKSFGIMQMAMAAGEQAEFDAALSKMPKEFQERHAKAVYEYELAHARTRTFEGIDTAKEMLAEYPDLAAPAELETTKVPEAHKTTPVAATEIPDPRTLEERLTSKIDEINRRRKNSPGIPRGDNTGGTILFAEMVDLVHELALRAVRAGVRGVDNLGKLFDELTAGKDPEIQKLRKDIIAQADDYVNEPELIEAKHRIARQRAEKADEIRGAKSTAKTTAKKSETSGNTPPPPVETPPGVGGTPKGPGDFDLTGREYKGDQMPGPSVGNIRFSMGNTLEKSSSRFINWLGEVTGERVLFKHGFTDEAKLRAQPNISQSASEATDRMFKSTIATLRKETLGIWDQYAKRENLNFIEKVIRDRFVDDFNDKIGIAIRAGRSDDPLIDAARKQYVKHFNDLREFGVKYGLPGFDKMPPDETYLWRVWDTSKIAKVRDLHGNEAIVDLLTEAAVGKNNELNRDATREVMNYFLDAINDHQYGLDLDKNLAFTSARSDIQDVISALKLDANKGADLLNRAKGRMVIDENASITTKAGKLSVSDLLDNNAETIAHVYARNIIGAGHMQEVFRAAEPFFGQKIDSLGKLVDLAKRDGANVNVPPETLRYQIKKIEAISNSILGHRTAAPTYWTKAAIAIRGVNYLARAGKFAIAQIPEAGMVVANKGVQAAINNMPAMKDIAKNIFNGKFETRTAQEIQAIWALGTEPMVNHPVKRFDFREAGDQFLNYSQAARQLNKAQYWLSNISGMTYIQNVLQMWAGVTAINTWANMKTLPSLARLKSQGLDEVWGQKIIDNIRQHSTTETGPLGIRVKELNIHKWDKDVASKFIVANDKWSRKAVQQNNIALYSEWMTSDTGKVLTEFRSFAIQAYEKQFLQNGQILIASRGKDFQAWMEFILPCVMGGLAYYAQTHMSSIGRADREEYLDEMLDPKKVGLAAFNRGGASSILPMGTDFVADRLGFKKPFSYARSSGLESDPLLGNPTFDALVNVNARLFRSAIDPTYSSTQSDLRDLRKIIPGQNLPVIDNILNYYQSRMPKKRTENSNPW